MRNSRIYEPEVWEQERTDEHDEEILKKDYSSDLWEEYVSHSPGSINDIWNHKRKRLNVEKYY